MGLSKFHRWRYDRGVLLPQIRLVMDERMVKSSLTLFYTRGLGIVVSHVMVAYHTGFPIDFLHRYGYVTILKFSFKWVKVMLPYTGGEGCL